MRRTIGIFASVIGASTLSTGVALAANTLKVGPGEAYATPCAAIAAAQENDVVEVASGTYTDTCAIGVKGLTVRGVGATRPHIDLSGTDHPANYKGAYVIEADDVHIENLEISGVHISPDNGENGAGLRIQALGAVVHGCYIHDSQNGILAGPLTAGTGQLTIENSEFAHNAVGDGCNGGGCTHNLYLGDFAKVVFRYNWSHAVATDTADKGHLFKSRAQETDVLYNRFTGEDGFDSYELDFPNGGLAIVVGNVIQQGAQTGNPTILSYGAEGLARPDHRLFVVNNTFVNDLDRGTFINVASGGTLTAHNNLFVGPGTPSSTGALSADNLSGIDPMFVDRAHFDYHLQTGSPAADKGVAPGSADAFSLVPTLEYVHPLMSVARKADATLDVGAFELGTDVTGANGDGGAGSGASGGPDGGAATGGSSNGGGANGGGASAGNDGGANGFASSGAPTDDGGSSGCSASGAGVPTSSWLPSALAGLAMMLAGGVRRRRTRA